LLTWEGFDKSGIIQTVVAATIIEGKPERGLPDSDGKGEGQFMFLPWRILNCSPCIVNAYERTQFRQVGKLQMCPYPQPHFDFIAETA